MELEDETAVFGDWSRDHLYDLGDLNQDGELNVLDIVTIVNFLEFVRAYILSKYAGDMNEDGNLNILDVVLIVNVILQN